MIDAVIINIGLVFRILAIIIFAFFVLPRQRKESFIKDGLIFSRRLIFYGLVICFLMMIIATFYNFYRLVPNPNFFREAMHFVSLTASFKDFLIAVILVLIYKRQYTE